MLKAKPSDVLLDVCTQLDYLDADGAHPVENRARIVRPLKQMIAVARWLKMPIVSCVESRRPVDALGAGPRDCIHGTWGQRKANFTMLPNRVVLDTDNAPGVGLDVLDRASQVIVVKRSRDPFDNPKLDRLLTELPKSDFILAGIGLEDTIRTLALGLLLRNRRVTIVADACGFWNQDQAEMVLRQLEAKHCRMVSALELTTPWIADRLRDNASPRHRHYMLPRLSRPGVLQSPLSGN